MKKNKKKNKTTKFRLNAIFFTVFVMFTILVLRLGYVQIVKGQEYKAASEATTTTKYTWNAPRGIIYDRNGKQLVENDPIYTLTYTDSADTSDMSTYDIAEKLAELVEIDIADVKDRDKKDYWIMKNSDEALEKITDDELSKLEDKEVYKLQLERITDDEINSLSAAEVEVYKIKAILDSSSASVKRIKEGLTTEEFALVNEHLADLPGIDVKLDSQRSYVYDNTLRQIFGSIAQIPEESADEYTAAGYDLSDLVGKSFLELQYESVLRGTKEEQSYTQDRTGSVTDSVTTSTGQTGKDLVLTVDIDLQQQVDAIVQEELSKETTAEAAYVVMMDPKTGEILSLSGKRRDGSKITEETYGTIYNSYAMGSAVKGATVLTGYQTGVISPGDTFYDAPITIGGLKKKSWQNMGTINDLTALERSSNVYMFHIAMKIGGYNYSSKSGFRDPETAYETMRKYFSEFGLGVETGIDLPSEGTGYNGGVQKLGNLMDLAIGQFDTYTPLQLAQYVSTIANDGVRMQPHLMKEIRDPNHDTDETGEVIEKFESNALNKVSMSQKNIERVQEGFHRVMTGSQGTAASTFRGASYDPAGKTGTAQVWNGSGYNYNLTLVGYAPYENPEVAMAVVVTNVRNGSSVINKNIGKRILDAYFTDEADQADEADQTANADETEE